MNIPFLALAFNMPTLLILLALALLIFGNRLPSIGRNLGKSITGFKKGLKSADEDDDDDDDDDEIDEPVAKKKKKAEQLEGETSKKVKTKEAVAVAEEED